MHIDSQHLGDKLNIPAPSAGASMGPNTILGLKSRTSSRDLDPAGTAVPFKERIRPGMVVSWNEPSGPGSALRVLDGLKLAVVLCPVDAVPRIVKEALGNVRNSTDSAHADTRDKGTSGSVHYLCALVTPGLTAEAYELNMWRQIVVAVDSIEKEVFLEYDAGTRYYYIST